MFDLLNLFGVEVIMDYSQFSFTESATDFFGYLKQEEAVMSCILNVFWLQYEWSGTPIVFLKPLFVFDGKLNLHITTVKLPE